MRKLLLFVILSLFVLVADAQKYRFFNDDFTVFMGGYNFIFPYNTLSKTTSNNEVNYAFQGMVNHIDETYFDVNGPGFLGQNAIWDTVNKKYVLFNRLGDSIVIHTNQPLNNPWIAYEKNSDTVFAKISGIDTTMLESGIIDTIKTIKFIYPYNNSGFSESVHRKNFVISRERGLLNFFNIVVFPGIIDNYMIPIDYHGYSNDFVSADMFNPDYVDSLSNADIFNLSIGDELHTKYHSWTGSEPYIYSSDSWRIRKVLNRIDSSHNTTIQYYSKFKAWEGDSVINQGIDTITATYSKNKVSVLPAYRYEGTEDRAIIRGLKIIKGRIAIVNSYIDLMKEDGQWTYVIYKSKGLYGSHAICGLGGWYYNYSDAIFDYYNKLVYYNVSGEEWGTPLSFTVGVNDIELESLKVFPNPVKDKLTITSLNLNSDAGLIIFDMSGKVIMNREIQQRNNHIELDVSNLDTGVYTIQIINGLKISTNKFIKIK